MVKFKLHDLQLGRWISLIFPCLLALNCQVSFAADYFDSYGLTPSSPALDLGVQPLGYPSGVISAVLARDRILARSLANEGRPLKQHPFKRGADMLTLLADGRLEAALLGDMPTLLAAAEGRVWIAGLVKQTSTAIVARGGLQVQDLVGKRIAYVEGSSAHLTLLQGLAAAGLNTSQVTLAPMGVGEMPGALQRGEIDAFAAWEPAPTVAMAQNDKHRIVFRGQSSDYFVLRRDLAQQSPQAALQLMAGYLRAIEWMRRSQSNLERAARWALIDTKSFAPGSQSSAATVAQIATITRREILDVPSAPLLLLDPAAAPLLKEFQFLKQLGKLPPSATWAHVQTAFNYAGLEQVQAQARAYSLRSFDYED